MQQFLLIIKGDGMRELGKDELQSLMKGYEAWVQELGENYILGQRLEKKGALLTDPHSLSTDGPFLESKEVIAGFILIQCENLEQAISHTRKLPHLGLFTFEVRPVLTNSADTK